MRPTVFVSSVIREYSAFRDAAGQGIRAAGGVPLRIEDHPSLNQSSRNSCLDLVEESDVYLLIIALRGGWTAPSGLTVTEEEFHHARDVGKPMLVFVQEGDRDECAQRLASKASHYIDGRLRKTFSAPGDLEEAVTKSLQLVLQEFGARVRDPAIVQDAVTELPSDRGDTILRIVTAPERLTEFLDPLRLEDLSWREQIYQVGHDSKVGFFSYERSKEFDDKGNHITITQDPGRSPPLLARLKIGTDGLVVVDTNVTGRCIRDHSSSTLSAMSLIEQDVVAGAKRSMAMLSGIQSMLDPHKRHEGILLNAALGSLGYRTWRREFPVGGSHPMRMSGPSVVPAFPQPRLITRAELESYEPMGARIVTMLRRGVQQE